MGTGSIVLAGSGMGEGYGTGASSGVGESINSGLDIPIITVGTHVFTLISVSRAMKLGVEFIWDSSSVNLR